MNLKKTSFFPPFEVFVLIISQADYPVRAVFVGFSTVFAAFQFLIIQLRCLLSFDNLLFCGLW